MPQWESLQRSPDRVAGFKGQLRGRTNWREGKDYGKGGDIGEAKGRKWGLGWGKGGG